MAYLDLVTIVVQAYDPAIAFFVNVLQFELVEDVPSLTTDGRPKRWVVVRPKGGTTGLLLARADGEAQSAVVGPRLVVALPSSSTSRATDGICSVAPPLMLSLEQTCSPLMTTGERRALNNSPLARQSYGQIVTSTHVPAAPSVLGVGRDGHRLSLASESRLVWSHADLRERGADGTVGGFGHHDEATKGNVLLAPFAHAVRPVGDALQCCHECIAARRDFRVHTNGNLLEVEIFERQPTLKTRAFGVEILHEAPELGCRQRAGCAEHNGLPTGRMGSRRRRGAGTPAARTWRQ